MKTPTSWWPWMVCGLLLLATLLNYMDRQALAVTLPTLKAEFNLAEGRVGMVEGCFGFAFAFGSLFFGFLADRHGPRVLYPIVLAGWSLAGIATAFAGHPQITGLLESADDPAGTGVYRWLLICRVVLGMFEAGHWPCALLTVRAILTPRDRTLGNGILQSGASLGAIIVPLYIGLTESLGYSWQFPFLSIGVVGLLWVPFWFAFVGRRDLSTPLVDGPVGNAGASDASVSQPNVAAESRATTRAAKQHLIRRLVVLGIVVATLTISWQFLRAWLALFLQDYHGYTKDATRGLMSGYFIAADIGTLLSGALVKHLAGRGRTVHSSRVIGYLIFSLLTACGALVPFAGDGWLMIALLFTAGAGILGLHPFYYALAQELSAKHMGVLSGALAAGGWIVSSLSQIFLGQHIEATKSYQLGLLMVGLAPILGLIALVLLWPKDEDTQSL